MSFARRRDKSPSAEYKLHVPASDQLEQALQSFDRAATLVSDEGARQVWRFDFGGQAHLVCFYPRRKSVHRMWSISPALAEFLRFQDMQRAAIPSPRAVAHLAGFRIRGQVGGAVILNAIPDAVPLDGYLQDLLLRGQSVPNRSDIVRQVVEIISAIGQAKFGHRSLGLGSFLIADGKVYLGDAAGLRRGGMRVNDLFALAHNASRFATRTDLLRGWQVLMPDAAPPRKNPLDRKLWRRFVRSARRENPWFGVLRSSGWSGFFTRNSHLAKPWSLSSRIGATRSAWDAAWPILLAQIESDQLTILKRDASGDVLSGEVVLDGRPVSVIIKRPRRKLWYRYLIDLFRPARAERMWLKAAQLLARDLPCEWPMLLMRRRVLGYTTDAVIAFERVPGESLDRVKLDAMEPGPREMLFRRAGRTLRAVERGGLAHYDAKSTNWIVYDDPHRGPLPVMIDLDGIRPLNYWLVAWGIHRLLRAMKQHPQYTPADSLALCQGYAPFAAGSMRQEEAPPARSEETSNSDGDDAH